MSIGVPIPVATGDAACIVALSGGKDSTAAALLLREMGIAARYVFADTGWEAPETYAHLDHLRGVLGPIEVVGAEGGMVARARYRAGFPSGAVRWCTDELKVRPMRAYHDRASDETGLATVNVVGLRGEESPERAQLAAWEDCDRWGGYVGARSSRGRCGTCSTSTIATA